MPVGVAGSRLRPNTNPVYAGSPCSHSPGTLLSKVVPSSVSSAESDPSWTVHELLKNVIQMLLRSNSVGIDEGGVIVPENVSLRSPGRAKISLGERVNVKVSPKSPPATKRESSSSFRIIMVIVRPRKASHH